MIGYYTKFGVKYSDDISFLVTMYTDADGSVTEDFEFMEDVDELNIKECDTGVDHPELIPLLQKAYNDTINPEIYPEEFY